MARQRSYKDVLIICSLVALCVVTRLPQLLSNNLMLDPDECVEALMAKHLHVGKDAAIFFYGQKYGFSIVETSVISLFYYFGGISDLSVKMAMLLVWTIGIIFFYKAMRLFSKENSYLPFLISLLFVCSPSWAIWSMKARGGYLTAFCLSSIVMYVLYQPGMKDAVKYVLTGIMITVISMSQPIWLVFVSPFVCYELIKKGKLRPIIYFVIGFAPLMPGFMVLKAYTPVYVNTPHFFSFEAPALKPLYFITHMTGFEYAAGLSWIPVTSAIFAILFVILTIFVCICAIIKLFKDRRQNAMFIIATVPVFGCIAYSILLENYNQRYLLPFTGSVLFAFFIYCKQLKKKRIVYYSSAILIVTGAISLISFKDYQFFPLKKKDLLSSINYIERQHVYYAFCKNWYLGWEVMFYSNERIVSREADGKCRYPLYRMLVDSAYHTSKNNTAIIDFDANSPEGYNTNGYCNLGHGFLVLLYPDEELIQKTGIRLMQK